MSLKIGDEAPNFSLPDQNGKTHHLSQYLGSWVLLYFYPKDDTPGCTREACSIRDNFAEFKKAGITVLGMSADSVQSHARFAEKYELPFTILSDPEKTTLKKYGAWAKKAFLGKSFLGIKRMSYLISPEGKIAKIYPKVKPQEHASEVLRDAKVFSEGLVISKV
jgi:peroxiredoxin Q/BCP